MARNGFGGFSGGGDGYVTAIVAAEISAVAIGTACSIGGCYCSNGGLDGSINGGGSSRDGGGGLYEAAVAVMIVATILRIAMKAR